MGKIGVSEGQGERTGALQVRVVMGDAVHCHLRIFPFLAYADCACSAARKIRLIKLSQKHSVWDVGGLAWNETDVAVLLVCCDFVDACVMGRTGTQRASRWSSFKV